MKKSHPVSCFTRPITPGLIPEYLPEAVLPENCMVRVSADPLFFTAFGAFKSRKTARNLPPAGPTGKGGRGQEQENKRERSRGYSRDRLQDIRQRWSWHFTGHREDVPEKNRLYQHNGKERSKS